MSWFNKNKKEETSEETHFPELPELPKLPELPDFTGNKKNSKEPLPQLPSFPTNKLGHKFSQDAIKHAVTGKREGDEEFAEDIETTPMMHFPFKKMRTQEIEEEYASREPTHEMRKMPKQNTPVKKEPIFIRIDKFEEGLKTFKETKTKISEIEDMLKEIRHFKTQEEKELTEWETEIQLIKSQIEKVDRDIFSKIE